MKPIKVTIANAAAIESALAAVNGKAHEHCYTGYADIQMLTESYEAGLETLGIAKARRAGAVVTSTSGDSVPSAYKYSRVATTVRLERRATGWFLTQVSSAMIRKEGGKSRLTLTPEQDEEAVTHLRTGYAIAA